MCNPDLETHLAHEDNLAPEMREAAGSGGVLPKLGLSPQLRHPLAVCLPPETKPKIRRRRRVSYGARGDHDSRGRLGGGAFP